jgi:uncharacterized protein YdiU (UPF0061 family)
VSAVSTKAASRAGWRFDNSYARLPEAFHTRVNPTPVREPRLVIFNVPLAVSLGLDPEALQRGDGADLFAGNQLPEGAEPIAQAYAGHQFGHLNRLGDGRAILLGEQRTPDGGRFDIQLKGPGRTPYSRGGDGRAALGPMLREYLISEAMHALGIPTTRSLAVVTTGEPVFREEPLQGAILTRVAASHIRVGTFVYFAARGDIEGLRLLTDHTLRRHFEDRVGSANPALALFESVLERQASLVAAWQCVGFVHGVMNTDNTALSGETIDYGPCAFIDGYDPDAVFSSIDHQGRYAFGNQPRIIGWNLARFAEALLPVLHAEPEQAVALAQEALARYPDRFREHWLAGTRSKLGLFGEEPEDEALIGDLHERMREEKADFTVTFRALDPRTPNAAWMSDWHTRWSARLTRQPQSHEDVSRLMHSRNPVVIPRNHRVEEALTAAVQQGDLNPFHRLLSLLAAPYVESPEAAGYSTPPPPGCPPYRTFCGT